MAVCVATRNRSSLLPRLVRALEAQTLSAAEFEVVIVDDGSSDATPEVLQDLARSSALDITVLRNSPNRGPAAARNRAWRTSRAPAIAFTDDDCIPSPGWLDAGLAHVDAGRPVVCGRIEQNPEQASADGLFARKMEVGPAQRRWFATANIFYRRDLLDQLGGFDEEFPGAAGEDTELGIRVEALGYDAAYSAEALVAHDVKAGTAADAVRDQARWSDLTLIFARHPHARDGLLVHRYFWRQSHPELLALLAGVVLAPRSRAALALATPWLHGKLCRDVRGDQTLVEILPALPGLLAVDIAGLVAMARGSIRHRTTVL